MSDYKSSIDFTTPDEFECETHDCAFNGDGICMRDKVKGSKPRITENDGCIDGVIDIGL